MDIIKKIAKQMNVLPKLRLASKLDKGGLELLGPKRIKFLKEPVEIVVRDQDTGKQRRALKFIVEHEGEQYRWEVPITNKDNPEEASYMVERLMYVEVGDEAVVEMKRRGIRNYIDLRKEGEAAGDEPSEEDVEKAFGTGAALFPDDDPRAA